MINKNRFYKLLMNIFLFFIIFIIFILYKYYSLSISLKNVTLIGTIINIYIIISFYRENKSIKSAYFLFQFLSIPFLYGLIFCRYVLNYIPKGEFDYSFLVTESSQTLAVMLTILCQISMNIGYIITNKSKAIDNETNNQKVVEQLSCFIIVGIILMVISGIPTIMKYYKTLQICIQYGYKGEILSRNVGINSIAGKLIPFFYMGILFLLYGFKANKKISLYIFIFGLLFYGSQIIFGERGKPLLEVLCLIWFYNYYIRKIKFKKIIVIIFLSFFLMAFLNVIQDVRSKGIQYWIGNIDELMVENIVEKNPILELNYEVGQTIYPTAYTIKYIPNKTGYKYGSNYLYALCSVIKINTSSKRDNEFNTKMNIAEEISKVSGAAWGGSYTQELYANFGWISIIIMFFVGVIFEKIDEKLYINKRGISAILITYTLSSLLWTIRNTTCSMPRIVFWYILPTYILYVIILKRRYKNG